MNLLYPAFLWCLLAIGVPILIHLLQLRKPQRVLFTNTGFIRQVELTTTRRRRLQELLVLLVRVLAISSLVLLFCQPYIPARQNAAAAGSGIDVFVDNTPSMQAQGVSRNSLLQETLTGVQILSKSYGTSGQFHLINQRTGLLNAVAFNAKLADLQALVGKNDWSKIAANQSTRTSGTQPLYVFSDFQKNAGKDKFFKDIPATREIVLVPQVARPVGNVYVDSVWLEDAFVRAQTNLGLHIRLRNGGLAAVVDCPVKVLLGTQQAAAFRTSVNAGQAATVVVQVQVPNAKQVLGRVVTEDTPVTFDNSYYFTLQPAVAIQVLEIGNAPVAQQAYANEPLFAYSFAKPQELNYSKLRQANLVLVDEVITRDAGLRDALAQVVQRGGSVVVVPTSNVAARESYHQLFKALGIGGEQWSGGAAGPPVQQEVAMPNRQTPFFRDVFGAQPRQAAMPQAAPILSWGRNGTDILRFRDGDSYLTEFGSGKGQVYVFAAPFDKAYSDFAAHALFVPVLYRLAMLSYHSDQQLAYRLTVPTVALALPAGGAAVPGATNESSFRLVQDSAVFVPVQRMQGSEIRLDVPPDLHKPGFYEVRQPGKLVTTLAFNTDRHESELAAYSAAELRTLIGPNRPNVRVLEGGAAPEALARYRAEQTGQPLWRYCLVLVLVCLLIEGLLLRFGRPKVAAAQPMVAA